ncbi:MAG: hypothetical protein QXZ51_05650 [Candidatus Bathyarchaeia archaeon]
MKVKSNIRLVTGVEVPLKFNTHTFKVEVGAIKGHWTEAARHLATSEVNQILELLGKAGLSSPDINTIADMVGFKPGFWRP